MLLSNGDMRKALNILQSAHAAHDFISEETIYLTTGSPLPTDILKIVDWLFNQDFSNAYQCTINFNIRCETIADGEGLINGGHSRPSI